MRKNKTRQRLTAMVMSAIMVVSMMPVSALAETGAFPGGISGEITAFEVLGSDIAMGSVPFGTSEKDLELPDILTATIRIAALEEEPVSDSGESDGELDSADRISGSAIGIDESEDGPDAGDAISSLSNGEEIQDSFEVQPSEKTVNSVDEITLSLPVIWVSSPEYDGEAADTYIFTPQLPEGLTLASGVEAPVITVTVGAAAITGIVTAFDVLPDAIRWQNTTAPEFPETVDGIVEGETVQIPVTWETMQEYDTKYPQRGLYVFTAVLGEEYGIEEGVEFPRITVYIPQTVGRMMGRMAGGGTSDSPLEITTAAQLAEIATLVNARPNGLELFLFNDANTHVTLELKKDIDLSAYTKGEGWVPIGGKDNRFNGTFDGGGHKVTNLTIQRIGTDYQGLFGCIGGSGTIKKLGVVDASITGAQHIGGVVGKVHGGTVQNCYSSGRISMDYFSSQWVGGVAGSLEGGGTIENCYSTATVGGTRIVGGVVGFLDVSGTVQNCYSIGSIGIGDSGNSRQHIGGIVGYSRNGVVKNCAALNSLVFSDSTAGRVAGYIDISSDLSGNIAFGGMIVKDDTVSGGTLTDNNGADKFTTEIRAAGFFELLFGNDPAWIYAEGKLPILVGLSGQRDVMPTYITGPITGLAGAGTSDAPYRIHTAAELKYMADMVNSDGNFAYGKYFRLEKDIDLSIYGKDYDGGKGWEPIGVFVNAFFDGNGKTIKGLYINRSNENNMGLFGQVTASTIQNLFLEDISLHGDTDYSEGKIGGLAGQVNGGSKISGCAAKGSVTGEGRSISYSAGGLVGLLEQGSTLNNCAFYGRVSAKAKEVSEPPTSPPNIFAGGIAGRLYNGGAVTNCISVADVSSAGESAYGGGIAGQVDAGSKIAQSAALGAGVFSDTDAGRIAGEITSTASGDPNNKNYAWSGMAANGSTVSGTANNSNGEDTDAAAIQTLWTSGGLKGWDTDIWVLAEGKLPVLTKLSKQNDTLPFHVSGSYFTGSGTSASDPYLIKIAADLARLAELVNAGTSPYADSGRYYKLINDLNLSGYADGEGWKPIGMDALFKGTFDGGGHQISSLIINRNADYQGLFGLVSSGGIVKNIGLVNVSILGGNCVGGVAGYVWGATVESCFVSGSISGAQRVGGVAGNIYYGTVRNCYSTGSVGGLYELGGVAGNVMSNDGIDGGAVENCYSTCSVTGKYSNIWAGGVVGRVRDDGTVKNCVALNPSISMGTYNFGRVTGGVSSGTLSSNYAFSRIPGPWENRGSGKKDGADVTSQTLFSGSFWTKTDNWYASPWDSNIWIFEKDKLPVLKGLAGQSGDGGLYLTVRDIQYAATMPNTTSFTYNGSQQLPDLTVTFDGERLTKGTDYTVSITSTDGRGASAGTKAGRVTLTITGIGSFHGTKNLTYTIGKKAVTITPVEGQSKKYGAADPVLAYTASPMLFGNDIFMGSLSRTAGENTGNYAITLGDLNTGGNYELSLASGIVNFTIEKRQITLTADNKRIIQGASLPQLTYTISNLPTGKTKGDALSTEPVLACPTFDGNRPDNYAITLTGGRARDNYIITNRMGGTLTVAEQTYTVTFNLNGGSRTGGGELTQTVAKGGGAMTPIVSRSGYTFTGWDKAFTNVTSNRTVTARWIYNGGGGSSSNSSSVIIIPPAADKPNSPTRGEVKVPGIVDSKGNITVNITDKTVSNAFEKALAQAKKNGNEINGFTLVFRVDSGSKTASSFTVNLPKTVQDTIIKKKIVSIIVMVDSPDIRIGMDLATVQEINKQAKSDVNITATCTNSSRLTGDAKKAIGSRPVFDFKMNYGSGKQVRSFGSGSVSVTIPYPLGANEKSGNVQAVYVDAKGKVHWLVNSVYDSMEKVLCFSTNHFSSYGIGYKQTNTAFTDIVDHWAKEDIEFAVSRGLFSGTSTTIFSPNTAMTRGMFVTALGRLANADVSSYTKSRFTDVGKDVYYMGYIEWASKNSIISGTGNGRFAPDQSITREQMAVIMQNYAKVISFTLPRVHGENVFGDSAKISAYAKDAVKQMQMAGVISGKNGNLFNPQGTATRAEVSAVLRRFVELGISSDTMQGWTRNDSGQWMYYENGKPVTGKKDIDNSTYTFDQYGVTADVPKKLRDTIYMVQKGDSFWRIVHKLGCTISELERLNNKSRFPLIFPGDVLRVPEK